MEVQERDNLNIIRNKARMKVTVLKKTEDENKPKYEVTKSKWIMTSGKEIRESWAEDYKNGIKHQFKVVNEEPKQFQFNVLYVLANGKVLWSFVEE